jgi:hypothetical protein
LLSHSSTSQADSSGWRALPGANDLTLPYVAAGEPLRSTIIGQLREEAVDAFASLLGAVPIAKDHRVMIPYATTLFCT